MPTAIAVHAARSAQRGTGRVEARCTSADTVGTKPVDNATNSYAQNT